LHILQKESVFRVFGVCTIVDGRITREATASEVVVHVV